MSPGTLEDQSRVWIESQNVILEEIAGGTSKGWLLGPPATYRMWTLPDSHLWHGSPIPMAWMD